MNDKFKYFYVSACLNGKKIKIKYCLDYWEFKIFYDHGDLGYFYYFDKK